MVYAILGLLLCLLCWKWQKKASFIFLIIFIGSEINRNIVDRHIEEIPTAVINLKIGDVQNKQELKTEETDLPTLLSHSMQEDLLGENSYRALQKIIKNSSLFQNENNEYYLNNKIYSTSLFEKAANYCEKNNDIFIILFNNTDKTLIYEKMQLSARKKNHSSELLDVTENDFRTDRLIQPGEVAKICHSLPNLQRQRLDFRDMVFDVQLKNVSFK